MRQLSACNAIAFDVPPPQTVRPGFTTYGDPVLRRSFPFPSGFPLVSLSPACRENRIQTFPAFHHARRCTCRLDLSLRDPTGLEPSTRITEVDHHPRLAFPLILPRWASILYSLGHQHGCCSFRLLSNREDGGGVHRLIGIEHLSHIKIEPSTDGLYTRARLRSPIDIRPECVRRNASLYCSPRHFGTAKSS
jgi:hypothetical protein